MKRTAPVLVLAAFAICAACSTASALYSVANEGKWPKTWPQELEPLRKQSRTLVGPIFAHEHYEISFTTREEFEAAWPQILKVKSNGAPVFLLRAPDSQLGLKMDAGVRIHCPPSGTDRRANPEAPLRGSRSERQRWLWTSYIDLIVDGNVVDLNRIALPADTPIIDERFKNSEGE